MRTAESVTPRHPDKLCDQISDAILDACLKQDPKSRVAIETMGGHGIITITGELTTKAFVNTHDIVRSIVGEKYGIQTNIVQQSPEIAQGVDLGGAGDQGIMVGYACDDNEDMIPQELYLARKLAQYLYAIWPNDGKTQVTIADNGDVIAIVASFQGAPKAMLQEAVYQWIDIKGIQCTPDVNVHANPAGDWNQGGFEADTGLTGRKLAVDNYGPQIPIGGGCFSGKDATKVDRSAAYMARKIAIDIMRATSAKQVLVKLAYAIGVVQPVMVSVEADYGDKEGMHHIDSKMVTQKYDLSPKGIIRQLELTLPTNEASAMWGHFGNGFRWEK